MSKSKWKDPQLDQTGRGFPTVNPTRSAKSGTGSGNREQFERETKQADAEFRSTTKNAQRGQRH
jgi:hypothetical protein